MFKEIFNVKKEDKKEVIETHNHKCEEFCSCVDGNCEVSENLATVELTDFPIQDSFNTDDMRIKGAVEYDVIYDENN